MTFLRLSAFAGFIVSSTLLADLNFKTFKKVLGEKAVKYWWLFGILMTIPLLIILYVFTIFFA